MPQKCSIGFSAKQPFGGEKTMNKKIAATILSVMFIMGLAVGVVPVRTAAFDIPTTQTDGIQNGTYLIQDYVCSRYFGFTTGQPICDRSPSMQNSEWSIGYAGNGKYSISYANSRVYGFLNNLNGTAVPAPNQQYWYIIKNDDGTYTFVPENDTSVALTTEITTAIDQVSVRVASSSSTGGTQKWRLVKSIRVDAYYDAGFKVRYGNNSDSTSNSIILEIVNKSQKLYQRLFGLHHMNSANGYKLRCLQGYGHEQQFQYQMQSHKQLYRFRKSYILEKRHRAIHRNGKATDNVRSKASAVCRKSDIPGRWQRKRSFGCLRSKPRCKFSGIYGDNENIQRYSDV